jgi:hypothetical protein
MKTNAAFLIMMLIAATLTSCKKDTVEYRNDFETSLKAWQNFKAEARNNYSYTTSTSSWTGSSSETTITVIDGKITSRSYIAKGIKNDTTHAVYVLEEWTEYSGTLNSHPNGSATLTLDQVYDLAKSDLLLKRPNTKTYFEAKNDGVISSAGYVEDNCADDCFKGINIRSVKNLFPLVHWEKGL